MRRIIKFGSWFAVSWVLTLLIIVTASAEVATSPIKITLVSDKTSYAPGEPIRIQVTVYNDSDGDVITHKGFMDRNFHLMITFTDPDGEPIRTLYQGAMKEPLAPLSIDGEYVVNAEIVPSGWEGPWVMDDTSKWYGVFTKPGRYTAQVIAPLETFSKAFKDPDTDVLFAYVDDSLEKFNPLPTDPVIFEIVPQDPEAIDSIHAKVSHLKIGDGTTPGTKKTLLSGADVYLYKTSSIPQDYYPINYKTYETIRNWIPPFWHGTTDQNGTAKFFDIKRDEYLILVKTNQSFSPTMGKLIAIDDSDWFEDKPIVKHLMIIEKNNGKKLPGKTKTLKGSELLITEPEYVEWDSDAETYPFVFESIGDWGVATSVDTPKGFVTDYKALEANVTDEMETVQFTITDKGSSWTETQVTYTIKHKNKTIKIESKIGIKLSKKLAKKKNLGIYGDTGSPGPFKGGKKIAEEDKDKDKDKDKGKNK